MFGFGWGEVVVIGIVALIAIGPKELPTVLRTIGFWMGKVRRMANEFQGQFQEALREAELTDLQKQAEDLGRDISNFDPMADVQKDVERTFEMQDPFKEADATAATDASASLPSEAPPLTDGAKLPAGAIPSAELPPNDVPMPQMPDPVTEKDFAPATPPQEPLKELPQDPPKQAGGGT
jgi:sec-independent protein translocase protein TatB